MRFRTITLDLILIVVATQVRAVDFGWESLPGGGIEYIFQVEPELLDPSHKDDSFFKEGFSSVIPAGLRDVRKIRLVFANGTLPNQGNIEGPAPFATPSRSPSASAPLPLHFPSNVKSIVDSNLSETASTKPTETAAADSSAKSDTGQGGSPGPDAQRTGWDYPTRPEWKGDDAADRTFGPNNSERQSFGVAKPFSEGQTGDNQRQESAPARPWWALVIVLVALFGSLGANVYLVWIHQAVRSKYRALVSEMGLDTATM